MSKQAQTNSTARANNSSKRNTESAKAANLQSKNRLIAPTSTSSKSAKSSVSGSNTKSDTINAPYSDAKSKDEYLRFDESKKSKSSTDKDGVREQNSSDPKTSNEDIKRHKPWLVRHVWWVDALLFIVGTLIFGGIATLLGGQMFNFKNYTMPEGTVPKIVFPIAWAIIYLAIGISTFLMWRDKEIKSKDRKINLVLYFVHIFFNILWPLFFFRLDLPIFSAIWLLLVAITAIIVTFRYYICNIPAGIIFSIYTLWLIYALYLNVGLVLINFL